LTQLLSGFKIGTNPIYLDCYAINGFYGILLNSQGINPELRQLDGSMELNNYDIIPIGWAVADLPIPDYLGQWITHYLSNPSGDSIFPLYWDSSLASSLWGPMLDMDPNTYNYYVFTPDSSYSISGTTIYFYLY